LIQNQPSKDVPVRVRPSAPSEVSCWIKKLPEGGFFFEV